MLYQEIRIGNYLSIDGDFCKLKAIDYNEAECSFLNDSSGKSIKAKTSTYDPITITSNWLTDFGFEYREHLNDYYRHLFNGYILIIQPRGETKICAPNASPCNLPQILYIHQLQNLFYSLTQKEL